MEKSIFTLWLMGGKGTTKMKLRLGMGATLAELDEYQGMIKALHNSCIREKQILIEIQGLCAEYKLSLEKKKKVGQITEEPAWMNSTELDKLLTEKSEEIGILCWQQEKISRNRRWLLERERAIKEKSDQIAEEEGSHIQEIIDYAGRILEKEPGEVQSLFGNRTELEEAVMKQLGWTVKTCVPDDTPLVWREIRPRIRACIARCTVEQVAKSEVADFTAEEAKRVIG